MSQSKTNVSISRVKPAFIFRKFAHDLLLLFYRFEDENKSLWNFSPIYYNKLREERVQDVINIKKMLFLAI